MEQAPSVHHWVVEAFGVDPNLINRKRRFLKLANDIVDQLE